MKMRIAALLATSVLAASCGVLRPDKAKIIEPQPTLRLTVIPQGEIAPGTPVTLLLKLTDAQARMVITQDDLVEAHTRKLHLLVIDSALGDYQHLHPVATATPGIWSVSFTPHRAGGYRVFADVTPKATGKQEFDMADIGRVVGGAIDKRETRETDAGGYHFALSFDTPPKEEGESMGTVTVTDKSGKPVTSLTPIMGAYGHIVAFSEDLRSVIHVHPMGAEPSSPANRGGPELMFHLAPHKAGFIKLYAQVNIGGKDIFAPFGVTVAKAAE